jgi:hypothetical protein
MSYLVLACDRTPDPAAIQQRPANFNAVHWMLGRPLDPPAAPLEFTLDPRRGRNLSELYIEGALLMREDLLKAFEAAGVDNLQAFPAVIIDPRGNVRHENYRAVNVVGVVSAVKEDSTRRLEAGAGQMVDSVFVHLEVENQRPRGLLMFRLAESVRTVLVHDVVVAAVEAAGFPGMSFYSPEDWV